MAAIPLYTATVGLNTVLPSTDIPSNEETGVTALSKAVNCVIDKSGKIRRAHGYSPVLEDGAYHSGFCDGGDAFCMKGAALMKFNPGTGTTTGIRSGMTGKYVSFAQHGDDTYYADTVYQGIIREAISYTWGEGTYLGPDGNTEKYSGPPLAKKLAVFNNRMIMVPVDSPRTVIWSELGQFGLYRRAVAFRKFESNVIMILPVENGLFVSTHHAIHFCAGTDPYQWQLKTKRHYPAIEWSEATERVSGPDLGIQAEGEHRLFRATTGACAALASGEIYNMTEKQIDSPEYGQGASIVVGQHYIHSAF